MPSPPWPSLFRTIAVSLAATAVLLVSAPRLTDPSPMRFGALLALGYPVLAFVVYSMARTFSQKQLPTFSLKTLLLVFGLVFCLCVLWRDGAAWQGAHAFPGFSPIAALSPDGTLAAAVTNNANPPIEIRDAQTGEPLKSLRLPNADRVGQMAFSRDGKVLLVFVSATPKIEARLIDWTSGDELRVWPALNWGAISASGDRFFMNIAGGQNGWSAAVFDSDRQEPLLVVSKASGRFWPWEDILSSTGRYLLVRQSETAVQLWNVDAARPVGTIEAALDAKNLLRSFGRFSADDRRLAVVTNDGLDIWDVEGLRCVGRWQPSNAPKFGYVEWSPKCDRLFATHLIGTGTNTYRECGYLLDGLGREIAPVDGNAATFAPNGETLATAYGGITIHDARTGARLATLGSTINGAYRIAAPMPGYQAISFSPDGQWLLHNGGATVWHRVRDEHWYGILTVPAFWGTDLFTIALLLSFDWNLAGLWAGITHRMRRKDHAEAARAMLIPGAAADS